MSVLVINNSNEMNNNEWKKPVQNILLNKKKMDHVLKKTKLCESILQNKECRHGLNCRFAHSINELEKNICVFGNNCKYIEIIDNKYCNKGSKECLFQHPNETIQNYNERIQKKENNIKYIQTNSLDEKVILVIIKPKEKNINNRSKGFEILKDKNKIDTSLSKTKMCSYGNDCPRGKNCRFAHSKDELKISSCVFGDSCKFIKYTENGIENICKTKICLHKHPKETEQDFINRTNNI